eukprot:s3196_g11.t1
MAARVASQLKSRRVSARGGCVVKELPQRDLSRTGIAIDSDHVCPCDFPELLGYLQRHLGNPRFRLAGFVLSALGSESVEVVVSTQLLPTRTNQQVCRQSKVCSHFTYADDTCKHYRINNVEGTSVMTYAKITDCTDLCLVEYDIHRGGPVYRKDSLIPQEVTYLASVPSGSTAQCATGSWLVQRARPEADYVDTKLGCFELAGEEMLCLEPGVPSTKNTTDTTGQDFTISLDWATLECPQPLTHEVEDDVLHPLVFDDPTTLQPDHYWLHPCDCVPPGWGLGFPANALVAEGLPPASDGAFIPPPLLIVQGQFACPSRLEWQVLPGKRGIYFETEAGHLRGGAWRLRAALLTALKAWPWPGRGLREGRLPGAVQKTSPRPESAFGVLECDSTRRIGPELRRTVPSTGPAPSQPIAALAVAGIETSEAARMELKHAASSTDATAGDLYALRRPRPRMELRIWAKPQLRPSNASCLERAHRNLEARLPPEQLCVTGGLADFQGNAARVLSRHVTEN